VNREQRTHDLEKRRIRRIARDYAKRGYRVITDPAEFPSFIAPQKPDLVAMSPHDKVIVEVRSENTIRDRRHLRALAQIAEGQRGWRFELVVTNPKTRFRATVSVREILKRLRQSRSLAGRGYLVHALLGAWSAAEATLRLLAQSSDLQSLPGSPLGLTKYAYSMGLVSRSSYDAIETGARLRNLIGHGYEVDKTHLTEAAVVGLVDSVEKMVRQIRQSKPEKAHTVDDLVRWFFDNYEDPVEHVPYESGEGGYVYYAGGPYDPREELFGAFPEAPEALIEDAAVRISEVGSEWVRKGQY